LAGGKGVEPLFTESESVVLPLNDPPIFSKNVTVSLPAGRQARLVSVNGNIY
jgi:hypothetical protein